MPTIRRAGPGDARQLSQFAESTFRATYGAMNNAKQMAIHCQNSFGEQIQAAAISNPDMVTLLCEHEGILIGYAQVHWGGAPDFVSSRSPGELQRLYIGDEWHGKGVAQALMNACFEEMTKRGSDLVWLGVWERNPRAIAFYRKLGFTEVGEQIYSFGDDPQRDIVMARSIASVEHIEQPPS